MQRKTTQRQFTAKSPHGRPPAGVIVAFVLLLALGVASFLTSRPARARIEAAPSPEPSAEATAFEAKDTDAAPSPAPDASDAATHEAEPTDAPPSAAPAAPGNPMNGADAPEIEIEEVERGLLDGVRVGIDPGHQAHGNSAQEPVAPGSAETKAKVSSGTQGVSTRIPEYEINLQVALLLRDALEAQGAEVFMTRETDDIDISNIERAQMMNELGAHVVLRLHCNGSTNQSITGIGLYVKSAGPGAEESYAICEPLLAAMGEATGARTESIHISDTYSGLNWSTVPSILVEMGYMSNPEEDEKLASPEYQALLVEGMVAGLTAYFTEHPVPAPEPTETPEPTTPGPSETPGSGEISETDGAAGTGAQPETTPHSAEAAASETPEPQDTPAATAADAFGE